MMNKYMERKMHMKKKLCALLLAAAIIVSCPAVASATELDNAQTGAELDIGIVAGDYPDVGTELEPEETLPSSFSNREFASPVRHQKFNTCWAYASTAVMEIAAKKAGIYDGWFSPMHMNYWAVKREDETGWQRTYTDAGYPYIVIGYLTAMIGSVTENDFSSDLSYADYQALTSPITPLVGANSLVYLSAGDIDSVKTAVYQYGSAVGNFHQNSSYLNDEHAAYYFDEPGLATSQLRGHAVAIVGWDDNFSRENFGSEYTETDNEGVETVFENHRPAHDGAWLCKNSWGESFSNLGGYFWISYEDMYLFDRRFGPSYAIMGLEPYDEHKKLYQNDIYGANYEFSYISDVSSKDKLTYINIFDFNDSYNNLDKVIFESTCVGSDYDLWYIPVDEEGVPVNNESAWTLLGSGTVSYKGYICEDIEDQLIPKGKGGIGVTVKKTDECKDMMIGVSEWIRVGGKYVFKPEVKRGQCYIIGYGKNVWELMDFYEQKLGEPDGGVFAIKALAEKVDIMGDVDLDGEVTILDVTAIQRWLADLSELTDYQKKLADYDGDGEVTILDCTKIQRVLADLEPSPYPVI